jgi:hypothetical protein
MINKIQQNHTTYQRNTLGRLCKPYTREKWNRIFKKIQENKTEDNAGSV